MYNHQHLLSLKFQLVDVLADISMGIYNCIKRMDWLAVVSRPMYRVKPIWYLSDFGFNQIRAQVESIIS